MMILTAFQQQVPVGPTPLDELGPLQLPQVEYSALMPALILVVGALVILAVSAFVRRRPPPGTWALLSVLTAGAGLVSSFDLWRDVGDHGPKVAFAGAIYLDGFAVFFMVIACTVVALGALIADGYLRREGLDGPEYHVLALLSASGAILMGAAGDLIVVFLGLEILSIALYVLAAFHRRRAESAEAGIKYFVLGAFSSAFLLYGIALVYGATGTTSLGGIAEYLAANVVRSNGILLAGMAFLLVGLAFKVAAVPFHTWTPDVYQGAPSPATGFMAALAKAAGFAALLRVFFSTFETLRLDWQPLVWVLAVLTLVVGSVLAVVQSDVKRMLAYSSVAHAGYVLIGLHASTPRGIAGSLFYVLAYAFMVLGTFAIVTMVGRRGDADHDIEAYRGLGTRRPGIALAFTVFLLAQAGAPFTSGFLAKFYVISAAVEGQQYVLALIAMLAAVAAAFVYLRVVVTMYAAPVGDDAPSIGRVPVALGAALVLTLAFTVLVGLVPGPVFDFAKAATPLF
ncbi:MAG TPA: NADH-quinone oxidoreductase subunit N [Acidimicrobiales bacterium]|nr:NADH-quinone oxidoreductase subunit N [Acidimicrobiales bacterium]